MSAAGKFINPAIIFKGGSLVHSWFPPNVPRSWQFKTSQNGWTSNQTAIDWLTNIFLPETTCGDRFRILVVDGHGSHATGEFMAICRANRVQLLFLPPHASHILQPLDLSCFAPIKARYRAAIANSSCFFGAGPVTKPRFISAYDKARQKSLTVSVITAGWRKSGMHPFNPNKPLTHPKFHEAEPRDHMTQMH